MPTASRPRSRPLAALLVGIEAEIDGGVGAGAGIDITGIAYDSRQVGAGDLFVAIPGLRQDGLSFVPQATDRGAAAVLSESEPGGIDAGNRPATWVRVSDARAALAAVATAFYDHPSRSMSVVGTTGTNGKTTVTALCEAMLATRGPVGRWSTTQVRIAGRSEPTERTTPEAPDLQAALAEMRDAGCWAAAIEVSSHALELHRVDGVRFAAAAFTNLTPDHLDFHGTMEAYLEAKGKLFSMLPAEAPAILNAADHACTRLAELADKAAGRTRRYGWAHSADSSADGQTTENLDFAIADYSCGPRGMRLRIEHAAGRLALQSPLFGRVNAENIAAAVAIALELGIDEAQIAAVVARFAGEPGRFERVDRGQPFAVLVDFAHTSGALESAIEASRELTIDGGLVVLFGCGGDRDASKRGEMGLISARGADQVIVTSDNPRGEEPEAIIAAIVAGIPDELRGRVTIEADRAAAICRAIAAGRAGGCVLLAGKGHETEQVFADGAVPFDDRVVAAAALAELGWFPRHQDRDAHGEAGSDSATEGTDR